MAQKWEVERMTGRCATTGAEIAEGDDCYSVLFEEGESFRRVDYSLDAWTGPPEDSFCHYKTKMPVKEAQKRVFVDNEMLRSFFLRLADETEPVRVHFRFVLALLLMRKRVLRYDGSATKDGVETWEMHLTRDDAVHRVVNPNLTEDQIEDVSTQLSVILHADMGEFLDRETDGDGDDQGESEGEERDGGEIPGPNE